MLAAKSQPVIIKRYARSRLYSASHQCYFTVEHLRAWAAGGRAFVVLDSETGADVTRVLLA